MATTLELSYFNTFWLKRLKNSVMNGETGLPAFGDAGGTTNGTPAADNTARAASIVPGNPNTSPDGYIEGCNAIAINENWFVEEARIRGGYNNTSVDFGVKAYIVEEENTQLTLGNSLIYSGVLNSKTGINNTNQFPIGEPITRKVDPISGTIQKLYSENTNLIILQERKVNRAPIDKDIIYSQEGQPLTANSKLVIGTISAFEGNWGISRDPGSFAIYGYNKYFTDRDRSAVLKLGQSGIEQISNMGMIDYFRDTLAENDDGIIGGYDIYNKNYVLTLGSPYVTLAFDELVKGWTSFFTYVPELTTSCLGQYYSFKNNGIYQHYINTVYNSFYDTSAPSSVTFVFNPQPTRMKTFKTINYEGSNGWEVVNNSFISDATGFDSDPSVPGAWTSWTDTVSTIYSYDEGYYINPITQIGYRAGFDRKQNTYYAALKNNSGPRPDEVIYIAAQEMGVKAFYATVKLQTDTTTDPGGAKELFSVGTVYNNR